METWMYGLRDRSSATSDKVAWDLFDEKIIAEWILFLFFSFSFQFCFHLSGSENACNRLTFSLKQRYRGSNRYTQTSTTSHSFVIGIARVGIYKSGFLSTEGRTGQDRIGSERVGEPEGSTMCASLFYSILYGRRLKRENESRIYTFNHLSLWQTL